MDSDNASSSKQDGHECKGQTGSQITPLLETESNDSNKLKVEHGHQHSTMALVHRTKFVMIFIFVAFGGLLSGKTSHKSPKLQTVQKKKDFHQTSALRHGWRKVSVRGGKRIKVPWFEVVKGTDKDSSVRKLVNTIPPSMMLVPMGHGQKQAKVLYCPNAEVGTTTIYATAFADRHSRCFRKCKALAWRLFKNGSDVVTDPQTVSFTHVRSPRDRICSTYEDKIRTGTFRPGQSKKTMSFVEFVLYVRENPLENIHWMPFSKRCLTSAEKGGPVFHYDHIIRMEDGLDEGLLEVAEHARVKLKMNDVVKHNTEHNLEGRIRYYKEAAAEGGMRFEELVSIVGDIYRDDIQTFGYEFERYN